MASVTPIQNLGVVNENLLFLKREDLLPFSFGGNKVRIAKKYIEDMHQNGKNCMVAYGNSRSNLCRIISNLCFGMGIECHIISPADDDGSRKMTSNGKLVSQCRSIIHTCNKTNVHDTVENVLNDCIARGTAPYYIYGNSFGVGNEAVPVSAYFEVYHEIASVGRFDYIFLPVGTGMTMAGLLSGKVKMRGKEKMIGISVARTKEKAMQAIENMVRAYLCRNKINITDYIEIYDEYRCNGYGRYSADIVELIFDAYRIYGVALDPVYTGKAYYGMVHFLRDNHIKGKKILFIHTGGTPLFFDMLNEIEDLCY